MMNAALAKTIHTWLKQTREANKIKAKLKKEMGITLEIPEIREGLKENYYKCWH